MFHVRRRPADAQPRRRKKKPLGISNGSGSMTAEREGPMLIEITHSGDGGRRVKLTTEPIEVGSANTNPLQLFGPSIQPRHCLISLHEGVCTVTPLHADGLTFVNGHHITQPTILHVSMTFCHGYLHRVSETLQRVWGKFNWISSSLSERECNTRSWKLHLSRVQNLSPNGNLSTHKHRCCSSPSGWSSKSLKMCVDVIESRILNCLV